MSTFILSKEAVKWDEMCRNMGMTAEQIEAKYPRRVILDEIPHGEVIVMFDAYSWIDARSMVDESKLIRIPGHGWFA